MIIADNVVKIKIFCCGGNCDNNLINEDLYSNGLY